MRLEKEIDELNLQLKLIKRNELCRLKDLYISDQIGKKVNVSIHTILNAVIGKAEAKKQAACFQHKKNVRILLICFYFFRKGQIILSLIQHLNLLLFVVIISA